MARYTQEHKQRTRSKIVRSAARLFRTKGYAAAGVDAVMRHAGLTHGGFYAHFRSKDALFAEAVREAVLGSGATINGMLEGLEPAAWLQGFVEIYLSQEHLKKVQAGCPLPSLLSEIDRAPKAVKSAFHESFERRIEVLAAQFQAIGAADPVGEARGLIAALSGALAMARAVPDAEAAEQVMAATRSRQLERIGDLVAQR